MTRIEAHKKELALATDKLLWVSKKLKNGAVLNLKQHCMHCYVTLNNVF